MGRSAARRSRSARCGRARARSWSRSASLAFRAGGVAAVGARHGRPHGRRGAAGAVPRDDGRPGAPRAGPGGVGLVRAATLGGVAAVTAADGPIAATMASPSSRRSRVTLYRPAHSALLPALCDIPAGADRANAVRGMLDSLATLGGPAAAAVLLAVSGPAPCSPCLRRRVAAGRGLVVVGALRTTRRRERKPRPRGRQRAAPGLRHDQGRSHARADHGARRGADLHARLPDRLRRRRRDRPARHGRPGRRRPQRGGRRRRVLGSILAFGLVRRGRLGSWFGVGIALFGAPLAVIGPSPSRRSRSCCSASSASATR